MESKVKGFGRDLQLDAVRCVAVFLIVLLHAWGAASQYPDPASWELPGYPAYALMVFYLGGFLAVSDRTPCGFFRSAWWLVPGAVGLALDAAELLGWCDPLGLVSRELLVAPALFYFVSRIPRPESFIPHPSYLFFLYCGHFLFCSVWVHALAPRMDVSVPGTLTLLIALFLFPGLMSLSLAWFVLRRYLRSFLKVLDGRL